MLSGDQLQDNIDEPSINAPDNYQIIIQYLKLKSSPLST